jgi:hypothetical protein
MRQSLLAGKSGGNTAPAHDIVSDNLASPYVSRRVLFPSHLLYFEHFLTSSPPNSSNGPRGNRLVKTRG